MQSSNIKQQVIGGFLWRVLQKAGTQIVSFIISIVLARILVPEDYGVVAMMTVFTNIAMVFINTGFSSSVIQKKDLSDNDISTMFYSGLGLSLVIYAVMFFSSPYIAILYKEPILEDLFRVNSLTVIIGATYSVQQALITRRLEFRKSFFCGLVSTVIHGVAGMVLALNGFGPWAIVFGSLIHNVTMSILMWIVVKWKPKLVFSRESFKNTFSFSTKMLAAGLLDSIFQNVRSLIIGTQYSSEDLAYYNKGYQFPTLIMGQVDGAITTVLFASLSKFQADWEAGLRVLRRSMKTSLFVCLPLMAGMCAVAEPMINILLTEKWAESVVYVRLVCIICMFWPLSAQRHALNSRGMSGVSLRLNMIGKSVTVVCLLLTYRHSVKLMIASSIFASLIGLAINSQFYRKYLNYRLRDQFKDIMPPIILSTVMGLITYTVTFLDLNDIFTLMIQVPLGIAVYIIGAVVFKFDSFSYILGVIKGFLNKHKKV